MVKVAFKWPRRSFSTSKFNSVNSISYVLVPISSSCSLKMTFLPGGGQLALVDHRSATLSYFAAVGLFNAAGEQPGGQDERCLKYDPFFNWYTCTCSFEECLQAWLPDGYSQIFGLYAFGPGR